MALPKEIQNLSELLGFLPGIGPKMSNRLALYLSVSGKSLSRRLSDSLIDVSDKIQLCSQCSNISTTPLCEICSDSTRSHETIIVVEDSLDLYNMEYTGEYKGLYQVLCGLISPVNGIGPDDIKIRQLIDRVKALQVKEIILALNPTLEGDSTSLYIKNEIDRLDSSVVLSRLAKGLPSGGDIEFASSQTLVDSFKSRTGF